MSEDNHDEALRHYEETAATLRASLTGIAAKLPPGHPAASLLEAYSTRLERTPYFYQRPNVELRRALWGPNQHPTPPEIPGGCYEASFGWVHVRPGCRCPR